MGHVFISYARADQSYSVQLTEELRRCGFDVWIEDIGYGARWPATLEEAVRDCAALIVIVTPEAGASDWVRKELVLARSANKPVFPLLLKGQALQSLGDVQYADVKGERMPGEQFFKDLGMVPGAKPRLDRCMQKKRGGYDKELRKQTSFRAPGSVSLVRH
jgi:hypothetical protein